MKTRFVLAAHVVEQVVTGTGASRRPAQQLIVCMRQWYGYVSEIVFVHTRQAVQ